MQEPIAHFYNKFGIETQQISEIVCGEKYVGVKLINGNIGVCATLFNEVNISIEELENFDINSIPHRIVANAYFNALLNYEREYEKQIDIFDEIDFQKYKNIVMVGFFGSLTEKFKKASINLSIFDLESQSSEVIDIKKQKEFLSKADVVILTSTTVFNNTFLDIVNSTSGNCKIFTLGPSTILHPDMFKYKNIHTIFGSIFGKDEKELFEIIRNDGGTKSFLHIMRKVCYEK
ncbi:MAG: DUF364 domain-containing protein [Saprospiraceae bacterium]|nr:DUF364 domain-containing protein [Saprospiraceae bacterium]